MRLRPFPWLAVVLLGIRDDLRRLWREARDDARSMGGDVPS